MKNFFNGKLAAVYLSMIMIVSIFLIYPGTIADPPGWDDDTRVTYTLASSRRPAIGGNGDNIHVVWQDNRDGNFEIYYNRSNDGGITWDNEIRLTDDSANSLTPAIAVNGENLYVVWSDFRMGNYEIYYKNSSDGGISWSDDFRLTDATGHSYSPAIAVDGNNLHVVWHDFRNIKSEIYYKNSSNGGVSWSDDFRLTSNLVDSKNSTIAVNGENLHVVWHDNRSGNYEIYYMNSSDGGVSWSDDTRLTDDPAFSDYPKVAVDGDDIHIVWYDNRSGNYEIYYMDSSDGGVSWSGDTWLTDDPACSYFPGIAVNGENLHVVWHDNRTGNFEVFYMNSSDGGVSWSGDTQLTDSQAGAEFPAIAVNGENLHVVWHDYRDGYWEIYYKKSSEQVNNPPDTPSTPTGPDSLEVDELGTYSASATDPDGDQVQYRFDWDADGSHDYSDWTLLDVSGHTGSLSHSWSVAGTYVVKAMARDEYNGESDWSEGLTVVVSEPQIIDATVDFNPNTLNLKSKGRWVTCLIELPDGYDVADLDISTIILNDYVYAEEHPTNIGDHDSDGNHDLMVKFNRQKVQETLSPGNNVEIIVIGELKDGTIFKMCDYIRVK